MCELQGYLFFFLVDVPKKFSREESFLFHREFMNLMMMFSTGIITIAPVRIFNTFAYLNKIKISEELGEFTTFKRFERN